jgi:hypothetical protein
MEGIQKASIHVYKNLSSHNVWILEEYKCLFALIFNEKISSCVFGYLCLGFLVGDFIISMEGIKGNSFPL